MNFRRNGWFVPRTGSNLSRVRLRPRLLLPALVAALVAPLALAGSASAATTSLWAGWGAFTGTSGAFNTTVTVANNPSLIADVTSDSRSGQVGVISGATTWLAPATPVGSKYGSSQNRPYLNLRPKADTPTAPSTTTYSFRTPTPPSGWTFVLGDIDAEQVQVRALGPTGVPLTAAQLGFRSGFNYCVSGVCTGIGDVPTWTPGTMTLTPDPVKNATSADTNGAAAWFEPSVPISSLTFVSTRRTGLPVFQTWFASLARDITGTVADQVTGPLDGVPVTLVDRTGKTVATATTAGGGHYVFLGFVATDGYTVSIAPPAGKIAVGPTSAPADLTTTDAVVDFTVRQIVPVAVSGTVRDTGGNPVPGATVTIGGDSVTTGPDGTYLFDQVVAGTYTPAIVPPAGYTVAASAPTFTIAGTDETPITGEDFVLKADPTISGTVTASGTGVGGVTVTATGPGAPISTVTAADGTYSFPRMPAGAYTITVTPPGDFIVSGPGSQPVTLTTADVPNIDFALAKTGSISGTVDDTTGKPVPGATVTVTGPGGTRPLATDAGGAYGLGSLAPGTYTVTLALPAGYTSTAPLTKTVTITDAGEAIVQQDFVVVAPTAPPTPPTPPQTTPTQTGASPIADPTGELADSGSSPDVALAGWAAGLLVAAGAASGIVGRGVRRRSR
jgi:hypothetical protein